VRRGACRPHGRASSAFAGRDVTAIALQLPDAAFRSTPIGLWARTLLRAPAPGIGAVHLDNSLRL